jgi:hypothetical protein
MRTPTVDEESKNMKCPNLQIGCRILEEAMFLSGRDLQPEEVQTLLRQFLTPAETLALFAKVNDGFSVV